MANHFSEHANADDALTTKPAEQRIWADSLGSLHRKHPPIEAHQFFGSHTFVDDEIGRVMKEMEASSPNAMVLFTADHGVFLESHRLQDKGPAMYEEITRIPYIVKWPEVASEGAVCPHLASHIPERDHHGLFWPAGSKDDGRHDHAGDVPQSDGRATFRSFYRVGRYEVDHDGFGAYQPIRCVRSDRYKLSIHLVTTDELYDLETDPGELNNLIDSSEHAAIRNELHDKLLNWMNVSRDPFRGYYWGNRPWRPDFPETWKNAGMTWQRESDGYLPRELIMIPACRSRARRDPNSTAAHSPNLHLKHPNAKIYIPTAIVCLRSAQIGEPASQAKSNQDYTCPGCPTRTNEYSNS